jgi:peptidoglycan/LPS O-acetylase OafA/YrhL
MPERLDGSRLLVALGALVLLVSLFLHWFKPELTAWTVFEIVDLLLAGLALGALYGVIAGAAPNTGLRPVPRIVVPVLALASLVLVAAALLNHPPAAVGRSLDTGAWIGLAGAVLMSVGALLGFGRVSVVITRGAADRRTRGGASPPAPPPPVAEPEADPAAPTRPLGFEERPGAETQTQPLRPEDR